MIAKNGYALCISPEKGIFNALFSILTFLLLQHEKKYLTVIYF